MTKSRILIGVLILAALAGGLVLGWQVWKSQYANTLAVITEQPIDIVNEQATYTLVEGWNFIAVSMKPITVKSAAELMKDVDTAGGYVTMVSRWTGDRWQEYARRGNEYYGTDFPLEAGNAYFVLNHQAVTWELMGEVTRTSASGQLKLNAGWNAVGLRPKTGSTAVDILDVIHTEGQGRADEIDQWQSGNWQVLVKRWYDLNNIQEYGDNFPLTTTQGYMIRAYKPITVTVAE